MLHKIEDVKSIIKLKFDDEIESENIIASYTHWEDQMPMFLIGFKCLDGSVSYNGFYIKGLNNLRVFMEKNDNPDNYKLK